MSTRVLNFRDLFFPLMIIAGIMVMFVPLPASVMDVLLAGNMALAAIVLMTTIFVRTPLEFSVFPVILITTVLMRLVLNLATTRLILTRGDTDRLASAGQVIQAFGEYVAGERLEVGIIIFVIIFVIQFIVITKGATRISEVAARFTLDGMPGKQMAIDADLAAGAIDRVEAQSRREALMRQADFFGAMDGASKFVRGDAIAGVVITFVNLIGGWYIGMAYAGMSISESAAVFSKLTIGDGLVTQIPAFLISIAAAILMTRGTQQTNLPSQFLQQLFSSPQVLVVTAVFMAALALTDLPRIPLIGLGAGCIGLAAILQRDQKRVAKERQVKLEQEQANKSKTREKPVEEFFKLDAMRVELGSKLVALADPNQGGDMLTRFATVRAWLASDLGILLPMVRVADRASLPEYDYEIQLFGNRIAIGQTRPGKLLAVDRGRTTGDLDGQLVKEPATGDAAVWIDASQKQQASIYGYDVLEPSEVVAQHIKHVARKHAAELLTRDATKQLIDQLRKSAPALVDELIPEVFKLSEIQAVLQGLLDEDIPIRQLGTILEAMADVSNRTRHVYRQVEHVRSRLARTISLRYRSADSKLWVATLPVSIEEQIRNGYEFQDDGIQVRMTPASVEIIAMQIRRQLTQLKRAGHRPILLVNPLIRKASHSIVTQTMPDVVVLSYAEITSDTTVEAIGNAEPTRMSKAS